MHTFRSLLPMTVVVCALVIGIFSSLTVQASIHIVGSSTVFPFSATVAEHFGRTTKFNAPVVESTGTGGGMKIFCSSASLDSPSITNASRPIKTAERTLCQSNGIHNIVEVEIGYDAIVLAISKKGRDFSLSLKDIFLALAAQTPASSVKVIDNPYKKWSDLNASLPVQKIRVLGPPLTSGTRDAFVELAMHTGGKQVPYYNTLASKNKNAFKKEAALLREDLYIESGENDNLIVQKLSTDKDTIGILGFSFLFSNSHLLKGIAVEGVKPSFETVLNGQYKLARSLFFYVKKAHIGKIVGLLEYIRAFVAEEAIGQEGYLMGKGLTPLSPEKRKSLQATIKSL